MSKIETPGGPTVSVLMTSYNREKYIAAAIESVLAQTYRDFELLIVDDCSTDGTVAIAERYVALDSRIRVIRNEKNLGQFPNRNHAATLAEGRFLKYADSDDLLYPHCLELMVNLLESAPEADVALSASGSWYAGPMPVLFTPRMCYQREFLGIGLFGNSPGAAMFRTESFLRIGGFPLFGVASDAVFWLHVCRTWNVLIIPGDLFWYRSHPDQEAQSSPAEQDYLRAEGERWRILNDASCPLTSAERELAKQNEVSRQARLAVRSLLQRRWSVAVARIQVGGVGIHDWLRYIRRRRIDPFAGALRDATGEFIVPEWLRRPQGELLLHGPAPTYVELEEVNARGV